MNTVLRPTRAIQHHHLGKHQRRHHCLLTPIRNQARTCGHGRLRGLHCPIERNSFPLANCLRRHALPSAAGSPPEQWDALSPAAKWQIILFIGFLEWYSEAAGTHYMRGGVPGAYPKFSEFGMIPHPMPFNLFDPFGFSKNKSAEAKANGLIKELNNGRLAMIGILGFISEQRVEGSVPLLKGLVAHYDGETMAPFG